MNLMSLMMIGLLGLFAHWAKRYGRGQIGSSFVEYMLHYQRQSVASMVSVLMTVLVIYWHLNGAEPGENAFIEALMAGYIGDSVMNKDKAD